jgi:hypothetical protein
MDFVERWFHVSPDGGNGLYEVALLLGVVLLGFLVYRRVTRAG